MADITRPEDFPADSPLGMKWAAYQAAEDALRDRRAALARLGAEQNRVQESIREARYGVTDPGDFAAWLAAEILLRRAMAEAHQAEYKAGVQAEAAKQTWVTGWQGYHEQVRRLREIRAEDTEAGEIARRLQAMTAPATG